MASKFWATVNGNIVGQKNNGFYYQKYFRLDANISIDFAIEIIRNYFPIEGLTNEYFEIDTII